MADLAPGAEYSTVEQAAYRLGTSRRVAYELIKRGEFPVPVIRLGNRYRIPNAALDRLAQGELPTEAAS